MQFGFLGHHSWVVSAGEPGAPGEAALLVDPVLSGGFGLVPGARFRIVPRRRVDRGRLAGAGAIAITHCAPDHLDLPSLALLDRGMRVYVGPLAPAAAVAAIGELGFAVWRLRAGEQVALGALRFALVPGDISVPRHRRRACSLWIGGDDRRGGALIQGTAAISGETRRRVAQDGDDPIGVLVLARDELLAPEFRARRADRPGLADAVRGLGPVPDILLAGGGAVSERMHGSDAGLTPSMLAALAATSRVHEMAPGDMLHAADPPSITPGVYATVEPERPVDPARDTSAGALEALLDDASAEPEWPHVMRLERELDRMAPLLLGGRWAPAALELDTRFPAALGPRRLVMRFAGRGRDYQYALDLNSGRFVEEHEPAEELPRRYPIGLEMCLVDFTGLLDGRLRSWDLARTPGAVRQWCAGGDEDGLLAFLESYFSEDLRPDLASRVWRAAAGAGVDA